MCKCRPLVYTEGLWQSAPLLPNVAVRTAITRSPSTAVPGSKDPARRWDATALNGESRLPRLHKNMSEKYLSREHYARIAALLLAGDIQAQARPNVDTWVVAVRLVDGGQVLWSNDSRSWWGWTVVGPNGDVTTGTTWLTWIVSAESVAHHIATFEYPAPPVFVLQGSLTEEN